MAMTPRDHLECVKRYWQGISPPMKWVVIIGTPIWGALWAWAAIDWYLGG